MVIFYLIFFFSITKEKPAWKMFAAFAINISTAQMTAHSLVVLAPGEICVGQTWLMDGCGLGPACPGWVGAGSEKLITLFLGTVIWREDGEIAFKMYVTGPQLEFMGLR